MLLGREAIAFIQLSKMSLTPRTFKSCSARLLSSSQIFFNFEINTNCRHSKLFSTILWKIITKSQTMATAVARHRRSCKQGRMEGLKLCKVNLKFEYLQQHYYRHILFPVHKKSNINLFCAIHLCSCLMGKQIKNYKVIMLLEISLIRKVVCAQCGQLSAKEFNQYSKIAILLFPS